MVDDLSQSVADSQVSDPNIIPPDESANGDPNRPVSTILADLPGEASAKLGSPPEPATPSADLATDYTPHSIPADPLVTTESATILSSPVSVSADSQKPTVIEQSATVPTEVQGETSPPPQTPLPEEMPAAPPQSASQEASTSSSEHSEGDSIPVSLPPNEPSQVQPTVPESAPSFQAPEEASQSAGIKPEHLEGTQNAPLADLPGEASAKLGSEAPVSSKISFGDLVSDQPKPVFPPVSPQLPQPPQSPVPPQSVPKTSFGDLVGIPPIEEPTISIEPIDPPKPVQPPQLPISPLSPQPHTEKVVEAKADFSAKRQQALQTRRKKREDHLIKIIALVGQKGKVHNKDVRDLLRVSQSTASEYLQTLVKNGKIKRIGKAKATIYSL